jgi:hypothetical protein
MLIAAISVFVGLAFFALRWRSHHQALRAQSLENARDSGLTIDAEGNIDAEKSFTGMVEQEMNCGAEFTGKKARFMHLMRVVSEGPKTPDEIRFLFAEGIEPLVRPDGLIYVPCIENEHLSVDGELELKEEDLDRYIEQGHLVEVSAPVASNA